MTEDFALVDFALLAAGPERVVQALGQVHALQTLARARARSGAPGGGRHSRPRTGFVSRLLRWPGADADAPPLTIHADDHMAPPPLARLMIDGLGFGAGETPFRVTAPIGAAHLTLVEFRDGDDELSPVCAALSAELPGIEVFRFRLSGGLHPGAETAFHVYLDGRAVRRAASISPRGTAPEAEWRVVDVGIPHAVEADSLPHARARAWEVMTPARQGAILTAMGVEPDALFDSAPERTSLALSPDPGGAPLSAAGRMFRASRLSVPARAAADAQAGDGYGGAHEDDDTPGGGAPAVDPDWEAEVTEILVTAVAHGLPEEDQVPWLTKLTARLERGDVEAALAEARALIARGDRPAADRAADADRLDELFGVSRR